MTTTWIIATSPEISNIIETGRDYGEKVIVVSVGWHVPALSGVDQILEIPSSENVPLEALTPLISNIVDAKAGDLIAAPNTSSGRVFAGSIAAYLNAPLGTGVASITQHSVDITRYGGIAVETISFDDPLVVVLEGGPAVQGEISALEGTIEGGYSATVSSVEMPDEESVDLSEAKKVVVCGRGFKNQEDLELAKEFAKKIGAELACTRPLAEGVSWMPKSAYIGVTGVSLTPELLISVGISGQIQHMMGCQNAKTIVSINNDGAAPIFAQADYGVEGDLYEVLPLLAEAL